MERRSERIKESFQYYKKELKKKKARIGLACMLAWVHLTALDYYIHNDFDTKGPPTDDDLITEVLPGGATVTSEFLQDGSGRAVTAEIDLEKYSFLFPEATEDGSWEADTARGFGEENGKIDLAVNGSYYQRVRPGVTGGLGEYPYKGDSIYVRGFAVMKGQKVSEPEKGFDVLCIREDRSASIEEEECSDPESVVTAIPGRRTILKDGEVVPHGDSLHPRVVVGVGAEDNAELKNTELVMIVIDGEATFETAAMLLRNKGARDGLEWDGGRSAYMTYLNNDGEWVSANTPSAAFLGVWPRIRPGIPVGIVPVEGRLAEE